MNAAGSRRGAFGLFGLAVGLCAGLAAYAVIEYWIDAQGETPAPLTALFTVAVIAAALLLLAEKGRILKALVPAILIAAILAYPSWHLLSETWNSTDLNRFPHFFWFLIGAPISGYLLATLAKASLQEKAPPPYRAVFFHGLTLPLIGGGAAVFAALALILLFAWAGLLRAVDVDFFHRLFQEPWFLLPFIGAIGGLSITMMRSLESVLGALHFILLLFCRIAMPITAIFSATFIAVLIVNGPDAVFAQPYPGAIMLGLAFAGMLIFNGVYQNGAAGPPALWLRLTTIVALFAFPIYAGLAAYAFWLRVGEYGLTPLRVVGLTMNALAALYSVVCAAALLTELNWTGKRWMPLVAPLNTMMAVIWILAFLALATPLANPWALSAKSQERLLLSGRIDADKFDYGYLRFELGEYGATALERLARVQNHPQAAAIRQGAAKALSATDRNADRERPPAYPPKDAGAAPEMSDDLRSLPLNPGDDGAPATEPTPG